MFGGGPFLCAAPRLFLFGQEPVKLEIQIHQTALEGLHLGRQPVVISLGREVEKRQQGGYVLVNFSLVSAAFRRLRSRLWAKTGLVSISSTNRARFSSPSS